jgi:hypothetical protein
MIAPANRRRQITFFERTVFSNLQFKQPAPCPELIPNQPGDTGKIRQFKEMCECGRK